MVPFPFNVYKYVVIGKNNGVAGGTKDTLNWFNRAMVVTFAGACGGVYTFITGLDAPYAGDVPTLFWAYILKE